MTLVPLAVIAVSSVAALVAEFLQWFFVWRTAGFQALKANLAKHGKRLDDAKEASGSKNLKKKEQRLQSWKAEAGRQMAAFNFKAGIVMMVCMIMTYKLMTRLFADMGPAARLPFEPPAFMQKVTHRGLTGADPRECSALFIFLLCQSSVRMLIKQVLNLGMGREFQDIMPQLPKGLGAGSMFGEETAKRK